MRFFIILLLLIVIGVLVWQNLQPVTLIFFGGSMIARLPLSIWIAMFTGAGLIASLIIQLLSNLFRPTRTQVEPFRPSPSPTPRPKKNSQTKRPEDSFRPSSVFSTAATEWNSSQSQSEDIDDWDIETPPTETTPIRDPQQERARERELIQNTNPFSVIDPDKTIDQPKPIPNQQTSPQPKPIQDIPSDKSFAGESINYEVPQSPQVVSRSGSVYSYTYRESAKSQQNPTEQVYDADFRVIKPPRSQKDDRVDRDVKGDDEEWI